ncbi:hypothetical protein IE990_18115 [Klebsiella pneumoniae]|uniref:Uncharacterized protein n=1 Tax=Klebsiella pneumoniae TaxID=573 RepID=A0A927DHP6_KLEPN|nr:hypothetical protein [Klebsiella pneumoniae]
MRTDRGDCSPVFHSFLGGIFASSTLAVLALRQRRHHTVSDIFCVIP